MRAPLYLLLVVLSACSLFGPSKPHYVVFFEERSAQLDTPARGVIAQVARRAKDNPAATVEVIGYTDSAGSPQADVLLSQQRAQAVADVLIANGVSANRLVRKGADRPAAARASPAGASRSSSAAPDSALFGGMPTASGARPGAPLAGER